MSSKSSRGRMISSVVFLAAIWLSGGCASRPIVPIPPVFNLYGFQRLAVVPFDNQTRDPELTKEFQDEMTGEILDLQAVPVIEASQVRNYLKSVKGDPSAILTDETLRKNLGKKFKCDILLVGSATGYNEFLKDTPPQRIEGGSGGGKWGFYTNRKVVVSGSFKLVDVETGSLLWSNKNQGYSYYNTFNPLPIPGDVKIPDELHVFADLAVLVKHRVLHENDREPVTLDENPDNSLLYPKNGYFSDLRGKAIHETIHGITADFKGRNHWTPQSKVNQ